MNQKPNPPTPFPCREGGGRTLAPFSVSGRGWGRGLLAQEVSYEAVE
jgi:hypothetical protein